MFSVSLRAILTLGLFCIATTTHAGTVTAQLVNFSNFNNPQLMINDGDGSAATTFYGRAGFTQWSQDPSNKNPGLPSTFSTFCIELTQFNFKSPTSGAGQYNYIFTIANLQSAPTPGSPNTGGGAGMGGPKADAIQRLWKGYYSASMTNIQAAAFQLAIWRLEYDFGATSNANMNNLSVGNFRATAAGTSTPTDAQAAITLAQTLVSNVVTNVYVTPEMNLYALTSPTAQDQITVVTPEPTSLCLGAIGGIALCTIRWIRRKK